MGSILWGRFSGLCLSSESLDEAERLWRAVAKESVCLLSNTAPLEFCLTDCWLFNLGKKMSRQIKPRRICLMCSFLGLPKRVFSCLFSVYYAHDKLDDFISTVNSHLQPLFLQIRKGMSESDGRTHYALVSMWCAAILWFGFSWLGHG